MKKNTSQVFMLFAFLFCFLMPASSSFAITVTTDDGVNNAGEAVVMTKKDLRKQERMIKKEARWERRFEKLEKKLAKMGIDIDLQDDVEKWKWFWLLGWAGALALFIIAAIVGGSGGLSGLGILATLGSLVGLFGTISLIIWLVKAGIV